MSSEGKLIKNGYPRKYPHYGLGQGIEAVGCGYMFNVLGIGGGLVFNICQFLSCRYTSMAKFELSLTIQQ